MLADDILFGKLRDGGRVEIDAPDGELRFSYAPLAEKVFERAPAEESTARQEPD